jgi:ATP-binding cassette subfamily E protein 1
MFDEPSSYLDVKQRLNAARMIRKMLAPQKYVIVVEHDLSVLDYLSDYICCLYGTPGAYGVVTMPFSVREGINIFLAGWVPTENMRFRDIELTFHTAGDSGADVIPDMGNMSESEKKKEKERLAQLNYAYPAMSKTLGPFHLEIDAGAFNASETIVMLGQNGTGKTTMIKMLGGFLKPDDAAIEMPRLNISMKPQTIAPKFEGTVQDLFNLKLKQTWSSNLFKTEVLVPLNIEELLDNEVQNLSGGELQRVAIVLSLAKPCDVYLIDEPSAYLDSE